MARARFRRKDLKRPDEFVSRGRQTIDWGRQHYRLVSQVGGVLALVALVTAGFFSVRAARTRQANEDLAQALGEFRTGHYSQAATQLKDVADRWKSTLPGSIARLYAGQAELRAGNAASAAVALQEALDASNWPPYLKQQVLLDLGYAQDRAGDTKSAADHYGEAAGIEGPYTAMAVLGEARCRDQLGDAAAARRLYERFVNEFSQAPEVDLIKAKLGQVAG